jgi:capsular polysaccharide biosynthesis protein
MLFHGQADRLRALILAGDRPQSFEGYHVATVECRPGDGSSSDIMWTLDAADEPLYGPRHVFGRPADASCLNGIGAYPVSIPRKSLRRVAAARIIGTNAVLSGDTLYCPSPCRSREDFFSQASTNNFQGFVLSNQGDRFFATYACRTDAVRLKHNAVFFHNVEQGNYGSFLIRQLPQMLLLKQAVAASALEDFSCYVTAERTPWFREAVALIGLPERPVLALDEVSGDQFASVTFFNEFDAEGFFSSDVRHEIAVLARRVAAGDGGSADRRLYVSRRLQEVRRPDWRRLLNATAIEQVFVDAGFDVIHGETLSLQRQIALFASAGCVAGPSGSGMLNAIFAAPGTRVLDLESFTFTVRQHAKVYASSGKDYAFAFGDVDPAQSSQLLARNWTLPLEVARTACDWLVA